MRISDWSSDVCSSDLEARALDLQALARHHGVGCLGFLDGGVKEIALLEGVVGPDGAARLERGGHEAVVHEGQAADVGGSAEDRSEERRVGKESVSPGRSRWSPCH